jgi:hypothetical protein
VLGTSAGAAAAAAQTPSLCAMACPSIATTVPLASTLAIRSPDSPPRPPHPAS